MSNITEIAEKIAGLTVLDVAELVKLLEEKLGVSAASFAVAGPAQGGAQKSDEPEQSEFDVKLIDCGANKINVIKEVRAITALGLTEAKTLTETGGVIKARVSKEEAAKLKKQLEDAGAKVELA